ncbi:MAG: excinuclease ABC subunit UvrB [Patescibacteria group bacterium]
MFKLVSKFEPTGDQPNAIAQLVKNLKNNVRNQVLLGVTGSGKTFTIAKVIEQTQKPCLIISHNKTLAAQLYQEFQGFFPENAVHYFVSYYDYYQPEAYIPQTDTYIEKDAKINQEIDRLRHAAAQDLVSRKDVIIVASVSCIYNIGSPQTYEQVALTLKQSQKISRKELITQLTTLQYQRNDFDFKPGTFRIRGDTVEISLVTGQKNIKVEIINDKINKMAEIVQLTNCPIDQLRLFPAQFWVAPQEKIDLAIKNIKTELQDRLKELKKNGKLLEAQRLEQRTNYDMEMLKETGYCYGIENYSSHLEFRKPDTPPFALLNYYPKDFLTIIDESHMTVPQLHAMYNTDRSRKENLIEYGFRLPSALDNRPLKFEEFEKMVGQTIFVSATPGPYEIRNTQKQNIAEQLIRPTGLLEPSIEIRPTKNQVKDLTEEIKRRVAKNQRVLVCTLTKRLAEAMTDYLIEEKIKTQYLHSEIKTMERPSILQDLRKGKYDVLVGINLLREGLDLPEVALVAILDADKEGFLRNETTLIQTMGRAARNSEGHVIMYADKETSSIKRAIAEIKRRRNIQAKYNKKHGITPQQIMKAIRDWPFLSELSKKKEVSAEFWLVHDKNLIEKEMKIAAKNLDFERAATLRDLLKNLKSDKGNIYANKECCEKSAAPKF